MEPTGGQGREATSKQNKRTCAATQNAAKQKRAKEQVIAVGA